MATGYTAAIANGISFNAFVMQCARAFGALVTMRDEPSDAEIPQAFTPSPYYKQESEKRERELAAIRKMTDAEAILKAKAEYAEQQQSIEKGVAKNEKLHSRYLAMLEQVTAWQPPSNDHKELKTFMQEQIRESVKHDCNTDYYTRQRPVLLTGSEWRAKQLDDLTKQLSYAKKEYAKECERASDRTIWIKQLRDSLA